jgi:hypothetical protein
VTDGQPGGRSRAETMRQAFDESFARRPPAHAAAVEGLLAIRVGGDPYVLRMREIAGLHAGRVVTSVPSAVPELMGLVGLRGTVIPVYDLAALLGYPKVTAARWLVVAATIPVALAFDGFDGYLPHAGTTVVVEAGADDDRPVREIVAARSLVRPILALAPVLDRIRRRVSHARLEQEP